MLTSLTIKSQAIEIIPDKLYWISDKGTPINKSNSFFFNVDHDLVYEPFFFDFGPVDIAKTCRFVTEVTHLLKCSQFADSKLYHHTSMDTAKRANAAFLMGAFQVIVLHRTAEEAWKPFNNIKPALPAFRDAYNGECDYKCTILDCLKGLEYAINLGWFNIRTFDLKSYEHYEKVEKGDLTWIIPGKLLAFSSPSNTSRDSDGFKRLTPEDYIPIFKKLDIKKVIRLSSNNYDATKFTKNSISHQDVPFQGSSCPSDDLIDKFIAACNDENLSIAVHCHDGLIKASILIACYAMKHYKFPAGCLIAWIRLCRPGSIVNKQQEFLIKKEGELHRSTSSDLPTPMSCASELEPCFTEIEEENELKFSISKCLGPKISHVKVRERQLKSDP